MLALLMPYYRTDATPLLDGFDGFLFPDGLETVPMCVVILRANQYMIHHCDYLIAYDAGRIGNTRKLLADARKIEALHIENIASIPV